MPDAQANPVDAGGRGPAAATAASPLVSVVMLCWNRRDDVRESLARIQDSTYPHLEIVVVDNGSEDGTGDMIRCEFPDVVLLSTGENQGIQGYNLGFARARGAYVVILDDDSYPHPVAIARMVEKFAANPRLGIVAFDVRNHYSYDDVSLPNGGKGPGDGTTETYLMGFNGAGAGVRKELLDRVGAYPGEFFLYWNEQDLSLRALDAGWQIRFFPDVVAYHKYSPANRLSWRAPFYYCRNAFWLIWKNYPLPRAAALTARLTRLAIYHSLEQRTWIYLRATLAAVRGMSCIAGLRRPVRPEIAKAFRLPLEVAFTFYR